MHAKYYKFLLLSKKFLTTFGNDLISFLKLYFLLLFDKTKGIFINLKTINDMESINIL